ncbi:MAG: hypothetical protein DRG20_02550 [Deltaproteobacteria bacterium]|nr:MAG: hypothetical protein DRG20_02550 [Deltaproteobacteria bacterium]
MPADSKTSFSFLPTILTFSLKTKIGFFNFLAIDATFTNPSAIVESKKDDTAPIIIESTFSSSIIFFTIN